MPNAPHRLTVRVYYEDTDFSGSVYHANYLRFMERGRTELLRTLGVVQADMRDTGTGLPLGFVVRRMEIDFRRPARMDDQLTVETRVAEVGGASLDLLQSIRREAETLVEAKVRIALVSGGRARRLSAELIGVFSQTASAPGQALRFGR